MVQKTIKTIKQSKQSNLNIDYKDRAKISRSKMSPTPMIIDNYPFINWHKLKISKFYFSKRGQKKVRN